MVLLCPCLHTMNLIILSRTGSMLEMTWVIGNASIMACAHHAWCLHHVWACDSVYLFKLSRDLCTGSTRDSRRGQICPCFTATDTIDWVSALHTGPCFKDCYDKVPCGFLCGMVSFIMKSHRFTGQILSPQLYVLVLQWKADSIYIHTAPMVMIPFDTSECSCDWHTSSKFNSLQCTGSTESEIVCLNIVIELDNCLAAFLNYGSLGSVC